jgi:cyclopropane-fatty-acyl-phospholipid synthase
MLEPLGIHLAERGWLPDAVVRAAIVRLCRRRLTRHLAENGASMDDFLAASRSGPIAPLPEKANQQHYELPPEFFAYTLGPRRKYSCCYWPVGVDTLDDSEVAALQLTTERAEIRDGMRVLELGCGWGSLALWLAERLPACEITAVSNSAAQREYIECQLKQRSCENRVRVLTADMNDFQIDERFDRVVSIEMFEHMRNHEALLQRISDWLLPNGALFVHIFCHRKLAYPFEIDGDTDWMARHFFTGGMMPSFDWLRRHGKHLAVDTDWWIEGSHYHRTCNAWLARLTANRDRVLPILKQTYGPGQANRWYHRWRMFYMACAELFGYDGGRQWGVAHALLRKASL